MLSGEYRHASRRRVRDRLLGDSEGRVAPAGLGDTLIWFSLDGNGHRAQVHTLSMVVMLDGVIADSYRPLRTPSSSTTIRTVFSIPARVATFADCSRRLLTVSCCTSKRNRATSSSVLD